MLGTLLLVLRGLRGSGRLHLRDVALHDGCGGDCTSSHQSVADDGVVDEGEHDFLS